jgi:hypothetical protein
MAKTLIRLSGVPQDQVKIVFTGLRPGEKLFEDLFYEFERQLSTASPKVLRTQGPLVSWPELLGQLTALRAEGITGVSARIRAMVKEIVPQYQWAPADEDHRVPAPFPAVARPYHVHAALSHGSYLAANGENTLSSPIGQAGVLS